MLFFRRFALDYLTSWKDRSSRKPLVIRGARQVGKSCLVRMFAEASFENLLEINFELSPETAALFSSRTPATILPLLEVRFDTRIIPGRTLLFLDEVQAAPEVFAALRYFHEQLPELHVLAAGSLLDFVLREHDFSMPVGRIEYLHLGPMRFEEFLAALGRDSLRRWLGEYTVGMDVPAAIHEEAMRLVKQYLVVGGLPDAVKAFVTDGSFRECAAVQQSMLSTFRDDFNKYSTRAQHHRVQKIFDKVPQLVGRKFIYSHVDREERSRDLKPALELLCLARLVHRVRHTHANGIPLGAEAEEKSFKALFLDVGLLCRSTGLGILDLENVEDLLLVNRGALGEQFVGQELLHSAEFFEEPAVYCWMRQKKHSSAEIDYVSAIRDTVYPIEVKAGKTGTLKSMHFFLLKKNRSFALRINSDIPSIFEGVTSLSVGENRPYRLLSLPFYLAGQLQRLCREVV